MGDAIYSKVFKGVIKKIVIQNDMNISKLNLNIYIYIILILSFIT